MERRANDKEGTYSGYGSARPETEAEKMAEQARLKAASAGQGLAGWLGKQGWGQTAARVGEIAKAANYEKERAEFYDPTKDRGLNISKTMGGLMSNLPKKEERKVLTALDMKGNTLMKYALDEATPAGASNQSSAAPSRGGDDDLADLLGGASIGASSAGPAGGASSAGPAGGGDDLDDLLGGWGGQGSQAAPTQQKVASGGLDDLLGGPPAQSAPIAQPQPMMQQSAAPAGPQLGLFAVDQGPPPLALTPALSAGPQAPALFEQRWMQCSDCRQVQLRAAGMPDANRLTGALAQRNLHNIAIQAGPGQVKGYYMGEVAQTKELVMVEVMMSSSAMQANLKAATLNAQTLTSFQQYFTETVTRAGLAQL